MEKMKVRRSSLCLAAVSLFFMLAMVTFAGAKTQNGTVEAEGTSFSVAAHYDLGRMYKDDKGVEQDDRQAVKWYRKAAEQGNADAQKALGRMYENGKGVKQDDREAAKWFRKAAE